MATLTTILEQFPWNTQSPEDWSDKEVYTHTVDPDDISTIWSVPILSCLDGFAYVGFRIRTNTQIFPTSVVLMTGDGKRKPILGSAKDIQTHGYPTVNWTPFTIPLPARLLALDEDEPLLEITFPGPVFGKVEFLAEQFDELADSNAPLWFCHNDSALTGKILTKNGQFYTLDTLIKRKEYPRAVSIYSLG